MVNGQILISQNGQNVGAFSATPAGGIVAGNTAATLGQQAYASAYGQPATASQNAEYAALAKQGAEVIGPITGASPTLQGLQNQNSLSVLNSQTNQIGQALSTPPFPLAGLLANPSSASSYIPYLLSDIYKFSQSPAVRTAFTPTSPGTISERLQSTPIFGAIANYLSNTESGGQVTQNQLQNLGTRASNVAQNPATLFQLWSLYNMAQTDPQGFVSFLSTLAAKGTQAGVAAIGDIAPYAYNNAVYPALSYLGVAPTGPAPYIPFSGGKMVPTYTASGQTFDTAVRNFVSALPGMSTAGPPTFTPTSTTTPPSNLISINQNANFPLDYAAVSALVRHKPIWEPGGKCPINRRVGKIGFGFGKSGRQSVSRTNPAAESRLFPALARRCPSHNGSSRTIRDFGCFGERDSHPIIGIPHGHCEPPWRTAGAFWDASSV